MPNLEEKTALGFSPNIGAMFCYIGNFVCSLGLIYSVIVLVSDKNNKFVRFHALQSILLNVLGLILGVGAVIVVAVGAIIDAQLGLPLVTGVLGLVIGILGLVLFVMLILAAVKAYGGNTYKLPIIGNIAEKRA